jgi:two-component system response regulator
MASVILHVEDDEALRDLVQLAFESYGFRGTTMTCSTVAAAIERLDHAARNGTRLDLVITDMNLPDGSGLEVVRHVRSSPTWKTTPVLVLSSDLNPSLVGRAYALGANAYIDKSPVGRSLSQVTRSLYEHWGKDVVFPSPVEIDRIQQLVAATIASRSRHAQLYEHIADRFSQSPSESAFWLGRALAESNVINLLAFLRQRLVDHDLPDDVTDELEHMHEDLAKALSATEHAVEQMSTSHLDAYGHVLDLVLATNVDVLARSISHLFPSMPVAMKALRDFFAGTFEDIAAWIDLHTKDPKLRERAARLRAMVAPLANVVAQSRQ